MKLSELIAQLQRELHRSGDLYVFAVKSTDHEDGDIYGEPEIVVESGEVYVQ